jgi:hypothetical protein
MSALDQALAVLRGQCACRGDDEFLDRAVAELKILKQSEREGWRYAAELEQQRKRLSEVNIKLLGALDMIRETLNGGEVDDLLYIINTAIAKAEGK